MHNGISKNYLNNKNSNMKKKIQFSNVFSNMSELEKNKIYKNIQTDLNSVSNDVKLLEIFANKDAYGRKKKFAINKINVLNNANQNKRINTRNNSLLRKKKYFIFTKLENLINSNLNTKDNINKSNKNKNNSNTKKINDSRNIDYILNKKEINKKRSITKLQNLKKLNLSSHVSSESNNETSKNNINSNNLSELPNINNNSPIQLSLFQENDENKYNLINNTFSSSKYEIPKESINSNENYFIKKFPSIIKTEKLKNSFNKEELSYSLDKISRIMQDKNTKIKNRINLKLSQQNLIDWKMRSKLKLTNWQYGISEINKNFVDIKTYDKPEEEELKKRKKFYDVVNGLIDELKHDKEEREINDIKNKYIKKALHANNNINKKEKNVDKKNDINNQEDVLNKQFEIDEALQYIKMRKLNEGKNRQLINNIFIKNDLSRKAINRSTKLLLEKLEKESNESKNSIIEKNEEKEKSKKSSFILINNYNKDKDKDKEEDKKQENEGEIIIK